jgi:uncharacterized protein involved in cysteine biosynthesis
MHPIIRFIGPAIVCLLDWDWDSSSHSSAGDAEFEAALVAIVLGVLVVVGSGLGFVLAGLLHGGLLLPEVRSKRHLFWLVPAINVGLYFLVRAWLLTDSDLLAHAMVGVPLAIFCGLLAAALLTPFQAVCQGRQRPVEQTLLQTDVPPAPVVLEPLPAHEPPWAAFRRGFAAPWDGFAYLCRHPRLWSYGVLPVVLNLLITGAVLLLLLVAVAGFAVYLHPRFPPGWGWAALEVLCAIGFLLLALGVALVLWALLQGVLCGYYQAKLAREVEFQLGMRPDEVQDISWAYQVADACRDVAALVAINGGFLLLHVVPVIGSIAGVVGSLYFDCLLFGAEYFDYSLALRGKRRQEKKAFTRRHRFQTLGLGAAVFLANLIPLLGAVLLATAVVGAVLLHRRLEAAPDAASAREAGLSPRSLS